jgi:phosphoribosylformylglycinamidine synthase I
MTKPRVLILRAPGTNCDQETAHAFCRAGAIAESQHVHRLLEQPDLLNASQILCLPGGFSYGDDVAAGRILANQLRHHLADWLHEFKDAGKLVLGICNGFQILIKSGILLDEINGAAPATLTWNESGRFEDRWVHLAVRGNRCVFLAELDRLYLPIAHAEGKFATRDAATLAALDAAGQLALRYCDPDGGEARGFPANPNGSQANVAGVCDATGRVFGLMPHPERHLDHVQHPRWTRGEGRDPGDGLAIFQNAVRYFV